MEGGGAKVRNKDRCLLEMDVIKAIDKHTREDGTLDDDISCILEEVESVDAKYTNVHGKWIPCSERLPSKPLGGEDGYVVQDMCVIEPFSAYWDGEKWTDDEDYVLDYIIAWMPLPEPYKGE